MSLVDEVRQAKRLPDPDMARMIRIKAGVSQGRMAREINVHRMTIARWESGARRPRGAARSRYVELLEQLREVAA
jgi:DNA-binding transcriptional regulator YiaG